jgi:hypothetical protein
LKIWCDDHGFRLAGLTCSLPAIADCENRIKELKYDFGLDSFVMRNFWAKEAALSVVMLAYNLLSVFRQAVIRQKSHQTLSTLHHKVLAMGPYWGSGKEKSERPI